MVYFRCIPGPPQTTRRRAVLLTIKQAAERLNTNERHVRNLLYRRRLPYTKVGALGRLEASDLEDYIAANRQPAAHEPGAA
jgi:excisionase family DNA binding protein